MKTKEKRGPMQASPSETVQAQKVSEFIQDIQSISPEQAEIIEQVRVLFHQAHQELLEDIKYGGLVFFQSDSLIGGIFPYQKHLSIEFSHGADFADPDGLLEGKGKLRRHLKLRKNQDIETKKARFYIQQAIIDG